MHGDFLAAWDNGVLGKAIKTCTNPSGVIDECPVFELIKDDSVVEQCKIKLPKECEEERCHEPKKGLCGDVRISDKAADYAEVVQEEAEDIGIDMSSSPGGESIEAKGFAEPDAKPEGLPNMDDYSELDVQPMVEPVDEPVGEPVDEPIVEGDAGEVDYDVPEPMITPHMPDEEYAVQYAIDNENEHEGAVHTITTTSDGVAYEIVVYEIFTTVTEDVKVADAGPSPEPHYRVKRHMHHHQQRHLHKHF